MLRLVKKKLEFLILVILHSKTILNEVVDFTLKV